MGFPGLVLATGCFDILHVGHIKLLEQARGLGDMLIVGINSDMSVRRLKGATRPIMNESDRVYMLKSLRCVDGVCIFGEDDPGELIRKVKPSIFVKGGDYQEKDLKELPALKEVGARFVSIPLVKGYSTTELINRMAG